MNQPDPMAHTSASWVELHRGMRRPARDALLAYRAHFRQGTPPPEPPRLVRTHVDGETLKFTLDVGAGLETESVCIPMPHRDGRVTRTLCVSSQVGCAMGCRFCETAQMGLMRHLSAREIVAQWWAARHLAENPFQGGSGFDVKNVVFMGMGEPMDNLDAVLQAIEILTDQNGPGIPPSNVAVSTVGRTDGIRRLGEFIRRPGFHRVNLAVSVNAPNDEIRSAIMPVNRAEPMAALREALLAFPRRPSAAICVEYVLIPGVNDLPEHCDQLCEWLRPIRCSLNVIPYNPRRNSPWPAPTEEAVMAFVTRAIANGQFCKRRGTKGRSAMAACGQLGNERIRARRFVDLGTPAPGGPHRPGEAGPGREPRSEGRKPGSGAGADGELSPPFAGKTNHPHA